MDRCAARPHGPSRRPGPPTLAASMTVTDVLLPSDQGRDRPAGAGRCYRPAGAREARGLMSARADSCLPALTRRVADDRSRGGYCWQR